LSDEHDGIIALPDDAPVGARYVDWAGLNDPVFDIAITPNRQECLGVLGIARDHRAHPTPRRPEGHLHLHPRIPAGQRLEGDIVHEAEVHDVYRNLRIATIPQGIKDGFAVNRHLATVTIV
jgi:hypothetical protein